MHINKGLRVTGNENYYGPVVPMTGNNSKRLIELKQHMIVREPTTSKSIHKQRTI